MSDKQITQQQKIELNHLDARLLVAEAEYLRAQQERFNWLQANDLLEGATNEE